MDGYCNFNPAPQIVAKELGIADQRVLCNAVFFDRDNQYSGFDKTNPLVRNGGKADTVEKYIRKKSNRIVFVGDAVTDLETKNVVDLFIGFGGVVQREKVKAEAEIFVDSKNLTAVLPYIL
jgi:phosphoserine phosphatase